MLMWFSLDSDWTSADITYCLQRILTHQCWKSGNTNVAWKPSGTKLGNQRWQLPYIKWRKRNLVGRWQSTGMWALKPISVTPAPFPAPRLPAPTPANFFTPAQRSARSPDFWSAPLPLQCFKHPTEKVDRFSFNNWAYLCLLTIMGQFHNFANNLSQQLLIGNW